MYDQLTILPITSALFSILTLAGRSDIFGIDTSEYSIFGFLKSLVSSPKIEVGEFTYYNDTDDPTGFKTRNVLYTAGPEKLIIGKHVRTMLLHGYRVIAHDRRGHGRSTQTSGGHDMDHYADDLAALTARLDLRDAIHVGHSTGGGEVARYLARHGEDRLARAVLISAVPPSSSRTAR